MKKKYTVTVSRVSLEHFNVEVMATSVAAARKSAEFKLIYELGDQNWTWKP